MERSYRDFWATFKNVWDLWVSFLTLLLLKIIVSMKGDMWVFWGWGKMCENCAYFFKVVKMLKLYM